MANLYLFPSSISCFVLMFLPIFSLKLVFSESSLKLGFRVDLTHVDAVRNFTKFEMLRRGIERDKTRIWNFNFEVQMPVVERKGSYLMNSSLGTPPVSFSVTVDTGSDFSWTQCEPVRCVSHAHDALSCQLLCMTLHNRLPLPTPLTLLHYAWL